MSKSTDITNIKLKALQVGDEKIIETEWEGTYWYALMLVNAGSRKNQQLEQHGFIGSKSDADVWLKTLKGQMLVFQNMKTIKEGIEQSYIKAYAHVSQVYNHHLQ